MIDTSHFSFPGGNNPAINFADQELIVLHQKLINCHVGDRVWYDKANWTGNCGDMFSKKEVGMAVYAMNMYFLNNHFLLRPPKPTASVVLKAIFSICSQNNTKAKSIEPLKLSPCVDLEKFASGHLFSQHEEVQVILHGVQLTLEELNSPKYSEVKTSIGSRAIAALNKVKPPCMYKIDANIVDVYTPVTRKTGEQPTEQHASIKVPLSINSMKQAEWLLRLVRWELPVVVDGNRCMVCLVETTGRVLYLRTENHGEANEGGVAFREAMMVNFCKGGMQSVMALLGQAINAIVPQLEQAGLHVVGTVVTPTTFSGGNLNDPLAVKKPIFSSVPGENEFQVGIQVAAGSALSAANDTCIHVTGFPCGDAGTEVVDKYRYIGEHCDWWPFRFNGAAATEQKQSRMSRVNPGTATNLRKASLVRLVAPLKSNPGAMVVSTTTSPQAALAEADRMIRTSPLAERFASDTRANEFMVYTSFDRAPHHPHVIVSLGFKSFEAASEVVARMQQMEVYFPLGNDTFEPNNLMVEYTLETNGKVFGPFSFTEALESVNEAGQGSETPDLGGDQERGCGTELQSHRNSAGPSLGEGVEGTATAAGGTGTPVHPALTPPAASTPSTLLSSFNLATPTSGTSVFQKKLAESQKKRKAQEVIAKTIKDCSAFTKDESTTVLSCLQNHNNLELKAAITEAVRQIEAFSQANDLCLSNMERLAGKANEGTALVEYLMMMSKFASAECAKSRSLTTMTIAAAAKELDDQVSSSLIEQDQKLQTVLQSIADSTINLRESDIQKWETEARKQALFPLLNACVCEHWAKLQVDLSNMTESLQQRAPILDTSLTVEQYKKEMSNLEAVLNSATSEEATADMAAADKEDVFEALKSILLDWADGTKLFAVGGKYGTGSSVKTNLAGKMDEAGEMKKKGSRPGGRRTRPSSKASSRVQSETPLEGGESPSKKARPASGVQNENELNHQDAAALSKGGGPQ